MLDHLDTRQVWVEIHAQIHPQNLSHTWLIRDLDPGFSLAIGLSPSILIYS